ncbi:MAG: AAA family ATPase [Caldilineaceae bacterium]|nr:AAA family ATPase [Caldilineaceae bacterium]MBP8109685.1 AAA family ATPase [Caldilineaceae bacterium]MBP8124485.1 AAA family ATPase [Caldilineaceae bacterium]
MNPSSSSLIQEICLENFLSFGSGAHSIPLQNLNVLIGPNGSGKSNLIEAIVLLRAAATDVRPVILRGGGVQEWIWKGARKGTATVNAVISHPTGHMPLRHLLAFQADGQRFHLFDERIENAQPNPGEEVPYVYYHYQQGHPILNMNGKERSLTRQSVEPDLSILAQRKDPEAYPELAYLVDAYEQIRVYREWAFGRNTIFRQPQRADMRKDRLEEDFSNLGLFLNRLRGVPTAKAAILAGLRDLYAGFDDFDISVEGGTVQVFFTEGSFVIPATRLSDGTLRYLCLLAILCDPTPPKLICIEEPELGLHPDILPKIADLLVDASQRAQLIVTTHSDILVDAMTERPESILVCEKEAGQTEISRLDPDQIAQWLEKYRLGELWTNGELGGVRW